MSQPHVVWDQLRPYIQAFRTQYLLWLVPAVLMTIVAVVYSEVTPKAWRASQALQVRGEVIGNVQHHGEFQSIDQMKVFQESIQQVARHRIVISAALKALGRPATEPAGTKWPTDKAIETLQQAVSVAAPKGADFGHTDFIFLSVTGRTPQQAVARTSALCDELEKYLAELRDSKAQSIVSELENTLQLAQENLDNATSQLQAMEREVGEDLGELRVLNEVGSGDSNLRRGLNEVQIEIRSAEKLRESLRQMLSVLTSASEDPESLLATPSHMLDSQPSLKKLKEGLIDAQIKTATLRGRLNDEHKSVAAAKRTEDEIRIKLHAAVGEALQGVQSDLEANRIQIGRLHEQQADVLVRLGRLANLRAGYNNLVSDVKRRSEIVDQVKKDLANAQATQNTAKSTSQLTRFHEPVPEDRPVGPGRKVLVAAGMGGGLAMGAGLVFLFMPMGPNGTVRRWNDYVNIGRRATDRFFGRRIEDQTGSFTRRPENVKTIIVPQGLGRRAGDAIPTTPPVVSGPSSNVAIATSANANGASVAPGNGERRQSTGRRSEDRD